MNKLIYEYYFVPFITSLGGVRQELDKLVIYDKAEDNVIYQDKTFTISQNTIEKIKGVIINSNVLNIDSDDIVDEHAEGMDNSLTELLDGLDYHFNFFNEKIFEIDNIHYYMGCVDELPAHKTIKDTISKIYGLLKEEGIDVDDAFMWSDED